MSNSSEPELEVIPAIKLHYGFRKRIFYLLPFETCYKFQKVGLLARGQPVDSHSQVFITDSHAVASVAMENTILFQICRCLDQFEYWRRNRDGSWSVHPVWKSVLLVDEIMDRNKKIYVDDSLIMNCQIENYDKVIPEIFGAYTRLVLHGSIKWNQLKRLMHPGVKQVRIEAKIEMDPTEYDDFVKFIIAFCRGVKYSFSFGCTSNHNHEIKVLLGNAFYHKTHHVLYHVDTVHVLHKDRNLDFIFPFFVLFLSSVLITSIIPYFLLIVTSGLMVEKDKREFFSLVIALITGLCYIISGIFLLVIPCCRVDIMSVPVVPTNSIPSI